VDYFPPPAHRLLPPGELTNDDLTTAAPCRTQIPISSYTYQVMATASARTSSPRLDFYCLMALNFHQSESLGELDIQQRIETALPVAFREDIECGPVPGPMAARVPQEERDPYWPVQCDAAAECVNGACTDVGEVVADTVGSYKARFGIGDDVQIRACVANTA
jgi:hypothetical protein